MKLSSTQAWSALVKHAQALDAMDWDQVFRDQKRAEKCSLVLKGLKLNFLFQRVTDETLSILFDLARQQQVEDWRVRMFAGEKINNTEDRAVLHTALRRSDDAPVMLDSQDVRPEILATQKRIEVFVDDVRNAKWKGATGKPFSTIVNIGIGGSDLGPRLAACALAPFASKIKSYFVANADAYDIQSKLCDLDPATTLFVIVSKTFTTQETLLNARAARQWIVEKLGEGAVARHFVAVSVNHKEVENFGIHADNLFPMWDWVGGRYSLWSSVGLSVALAIGNENFHDLLAGAAAMDAHFQTAPISENLPIVLALLGIWNRNFLHTTTHAVLPYCERLRELPRYLQQLEMESNGKSVTRSGEPVDYATAPVVFGECGTIAQHSFLQCLHQGSDIVPTDFIAVLRDTMNKPDHHRVVLSNLVAQAGALAFGQKAADSLNNIYQGGRPSNLISIESLDPYHLGLLLALYEHKTFVQGIIWDINSFDQPGVELGKRLAKRLEVGDCSESQSDTLFSVYRNFLAC